MQVCNNNRAVGVGSIKVMIVVRSTAMAMAGHERLLQLELE